jgi:hypothetical protein
MKPDLTERYLNCELGVYREGGICSLLRNLKMFEVGSWRFEVNPKAERG